jgi:hypothetical protein
MTFDRSVNLSSFQKVGHLLSLSFARGISSTLGFTQSLTEMITRNFPRVKGRPALSESTL